MSIGGSRLIPDEKKERPFPNRLGDLEIAFPCANRFQERFALVAKRRLQFLGAIAIAAGPWFSSILVTAIAAGVRIFHAERLKIVFPVGPLFRQRRIAKTAFHPGGDAVSIQPRLVHVVQILVARDRPLAERSTVDRLQQRFDLAGSDFRFDEIAHVEN
jgi:hypothetical protein